MPLKRLTSTPNNTTRRRNSTLPHKDYKEDRQPENISVPAFLLPNLLLTKYRKTRIIRISLRRTSPLLIARITIPLVRGRSVARSLSQATILRILRA